MIKWLGKRLIIFISLIAVLSASFACQLFSFGKEEEIARRESSYTIDPNTILESLAHGEDDIFIIQEVTPEALAPIPSQPVSWNQDDFLQIADGLHKFVWDESLKDWVLGSIQFGMDCVNADDGPQYAYFGLYKVIQNNSEQRKRIVHKIYILHQANTLSWVETEYSSQIRNWLELDLTQVKIFVSDALNIAETNGGFRARSAVKNECQIGLFLAPGSEYNGWQVIYSGSQGGLFSIRIDPLTGKFQLMKPGP